MYRVTVAVRVFRIHLKDTFDSEELLFKQMPGLKKLSDGTANLVIPDHRSDALFGESVAVRDLARDVSTVLDREVVSVAVSTAAWPIADSEHTRGQAELSIWQPYLSQLSYFAHAKFYFIDAAFNDGSRTSWMAEFGFRGFARTRSGVWQTVRAVVDTQWQRKDTDGSAYDGWKISEWHTRRFD